MRAGGREAHWSYQTRTVPEEKGFIQRTLNAAPASSLQANLSSTICT